jgi:lipoprotein-anchoring transpeptidase ErfK/SrfK
MTNVVKGVLVLATIGGLAGAAQPASAGTEGAEPGSAASLSIHVDLSARTLTVMRDGEEIQSFPVAVGQPKHPTPTGDFRIRHVVWNPKWVPPDAGWAKGKKARAPGDPKNPMGRVKLFFKEPDLYIHGTHDLESLGEAESHGCVRMRNVDAIEVAKLVMAAGGKPEEPSWFRRVLDHFTSTREVYLSNSVPVEITK